MYFVQAVSSTSNAIFSISTFEDIYPDLFQEVLRQGTWICDVQWDTIYFNKKIEEEKWELKDNGEKRVQLVTKCPRQF